MQHRHFTHEQFTLAAIDDIPILGQMNRFIEFEVCFYRWQGEFEVKPGPR